MSPVITELMRAEIEKSLLHMADLLRYASAVTYESGDGLNGPRRDLAFSGVHLVGEAPTELDRLLSQVEVCNGPR